MHGHGRSVSIESIGWRGDSKKNCKVGMVTANKSFAMIGGDGGQIKFEMRDNVCSLYKFHRFLLFFALVLTFFFF